MKQLIILALLLSLTYATCFYDSSLDRVRCLETQTSPHASVRAQNPIPSMAILAANVSNSFPNNTESLGRNQTEPGIIRSAQSFRNLAKYNETRINSPLDHDLQAIYDKYGRNGKNMDENGTLRNISNSVSITYAYDIKCEMARTKDWQTYLSIMRGEGIDISDEGVNQKAKDSILDNLLKSRSSAQAICMRSINP